MSCTVQEKERSGTINPIYNCQPAGAQYASIGLKDSIGIVHGGQGCVMFVRLSFEQHFKENFDLASSSIHESAAVFGGIKRIDEAIDVLVERYPSVRIVPLITTCSTETIGDDMEGVVRKATKRLKEKYPDRDIALVVMHTPSYSGSMVTGYNNAVTALVKTLAKRTEPNGKINLFTGWCNPGDVIELKSYLQAMDIEANVLIDTETFDSPTMPDKNNFTHGNTSWEDVADTANASGSIALSRYECAQAADFLSTKFKVPSKVIDTPIGIRNTDKLLRQLTDLTGHEIPESLIRERGKALDAMADVAHMFLADRKVAIYGNPDMVLGLADFCRELEMKPTLLLLGDDDKRYATDPRVVALKDEADWPMEIVTNADLWELEKRVKADPSAFDLILGHSKGRFIAIDAQIPFVRVGFPTFDRAGLWKLPIMGYRGAENLANTIANTIFADMEYKKKKEWILNVW